MKKPKTKAAKSKAGFSKSARSSPKKAGKGSAKPAAKTAAKPLKGAKSTVRGAPSLKSKQTKTSKPPRHDTPVDMPAVVPAVVVDAPARERPYSVTTLARHSGHRSLIDKLNAGEQAHPEGAEASEAALARLSNIETLEEAYEAWRELVAEHLALRARYGVERERLEREGEFLLGAVRAAAGSGEGAESQALATSTGLSKFIADAEEKLVSAREALTKEIASREQAFDDAFAQVKAEIRARVERYADGMKIALKLLIRPAGPTKNILHVERLSQDASVLLLYSLHHTIPTRYGFLFDDSTEDVGLSPPPLFADDGVEPNQTRPDVKALRARVEKPGQPALALKGFIPVFVPKAGGADFFRMLQRGAVMEVELEDASGFRSVLTREEGERFAGHLLRLKLAGKLELEIVAG